MVPKALLANKVSVVCKASWVLPDLPESRLNAVTLGHLDHQEKLVRWV